uniref:DOMON domain-containing protein n=1 Tax=Caenorhabditis tropicalis TaxID=1561998 RepID=A0A1I7TD21_9PELO
MFLSNILLFLLAVNSTFQRSIVQNTDCSFHSSNYSINWTFDELSNDIVFKLTSRSDFTNFYTAIAFGNEKPEDVIAVYVRSLQIGLIDGHLVDDGAIESDEKTNVQALQFDLQNGVLTAQFARPIETFDSQDSDLGSCVTMFFLTEPREIITGAPLELGNSLQKVRICDIAVTCATKMHNDVLVKRQEDGDVAPICSTGEDQKNRIEWKVDDDLIHFSVFQNTKKGRWWSAIGVGESMSDLNMILLFAENGNLKKQGIFRTEGKMMPMDVEYDGIKLRKELAIQENGKAHFDVSIEKKFFLDRADEQGCFTMQIALLAGQYKPNFNVMKHQTTPQPIQICNVDACKIPVEPQQEIDGETPNRTEGALVKGDEDIFEASGATEPTKAAPINDVEGSGLPVEPKIENQEPKTTPHTSEVADEKPLTNDDAPNVVPSISTASSALPSVSSSSSSAAVDVNSASSSSLNAASVTSSTPIPEALTPEKSPFFLRFTQNSLEFTPDHVFAVDNQTTKRAKSDDEKAEEKVDDVPEETTKTSAGSVGNGTKNGCGAEHEDLKICESYFAEYLGKVKDWSEKHNMTVASHMWKACTLLSQVQHVTTMCCTIYRNTCASYLNE